MGIAFRVSAGAGREFRDEMQRFSRIGAEPGGEFREQRDRFRVSAPVEREFRDEM